MSSVNALNSRPAKALSASRIYRERMRWLLSSSKAATTSRSPSLGLAKHHICGIPSPEQTR